MRSRRVLLGVVAATAAMVLSGAAPASAAHPGVFRTTLSGAAEVPVAGDPDGSGRAIVLVNTAEDEVCALLKVRDIETPTAAHIHEAPAGVAGGVVLALETPPTTGASWACYDVSGELADDLRANPADYYVNVHNAEFPGGALRGQLG